MDGIAENDQHVRLLKELHEKNCKCEKIINKPCDCELRFNVSRRLLAFSNFPLNHLCVEREKAFEYIKDEDKKIITAFLNNIDYSVKLGLSFFFYGINGVGKTTSAVKLIEDICFYYRQKDHYNLSLNYWFMSAFELFNLYYSNKGQFDYTTSADILIIDDFGRESFFVDTSEAAKKQYYTIYDSIFRSRSNSNKPTIITSNIGIHEIDDKLSVSIKSILGMQMSLSCVKKCQHLKNSKICPILLHKNLEEITECKEKNHKCQECNNKISFEPRFNGRYKFIHFSESKNDVRANYEGQKWDKILKNG